MRGMSMQNLVHKSVYIEPEVWLRLKVNAELSDLTLRDYLRQLILNSSPVDRPDDDDDVAPIAGE